MAFFGLSGVLDYFKDDLAKIRGKVADTNDRFVNGYVNRLVCAVDKSSTDAVLKMIREDKTLSARDVAIIALRYNKGGKTPSSKKAAFAAIAKRALEIRHFHAKNRIGGKAKPW
jgi:hypothetical protein